MMFADMVTSNKNSFQGKNNDSEEQGSRETPQGHG